MQARLSSSGPLVSRWEGFTFAQATPEDGSAKRQGFLPEKIVGEGTRPVTNPRLETSTWKRRVRPAILPTFYIQSDTYCCFPNEVLVERSRKFYAAG